MSDTQTSQPKPKVRVDGDTCIGCGTCTVVAPQVFDLASDNKATVKSDADLADAGLVLTAAKSCPVSAIIVCDEAGNQIYPVLK